MTFDPNADISGGRVRRRGRTAGIAAGGVGLGAIAIFLVSQLLGVDLSGLTGGQDAGSSTQQIGTGDQAVDCSTGAEANASIDCRMQGAAAVSTDGDERKSRDIESADAIPQLQHDFIDFPANRFFQ